MEFDTYRSLAGGLSLPCARSILWLIVDHMCVKFPLYDSTFLFRDLEVFGFTPR